MSDANDANSNLLFSRFAANPPASHEEIEKAQQRLGFRLPKSYVDFLLTRNGGEGFVGKHYLVLWKVEDLITMNEAYHVAEFVPKILLFGSDGGGEAFGFDTRFEPCSIISTPFIGMSLQLTKTIAPDFESFLLAFFNCNGRSGI